MEPIFFIFIIFVFLFDQMIKLEMLGISGLMTNQFKKRIKIDVSSFYIFFIYIKYLMNKLIIKN